MKFFVRSTLKVLRLSWLPAGFLTASFLSSTTVMADPTGAMILYPSTDGATIKRMEEKLAGAGCDIWRQGIIGPARRGNISIGENDRFALVDCQDKGSGPAGVGSVLSEIVTPENGAIAFIGPYIRREARFADGPSTKERPYILKISHMNNSDVKRFRHEYDSFMETTMKLENAFHFEAAISASVAIGMARPDMVEIFYYDDRKAQRQFFADNPGIMPFSRKFNADHMANFLYMPASPK